MSHLLHIDGSRGEGGGQILRTSLSLSAITGRPIHIERIRAGRQKPGLRNQHLCCVQAAARICDAEVEGAELGATSLRFVPGKVRCGEHSFRIPTAGSSSLVVQTVLPPLLCAGGRSSVLVEGGTHNPMSPPFEFLQRAFLPLLLRTGLQVRAELLRHGFFPAGGGQVRVSVEHPGVRLGRLALLEAGPVRRREARAVTSRLPAHVARRELDTVRRILGFGADELRADIVHDCAGPGNVLLLTVERDDVAEVATGFGERGVRAEDVAAGAIRELGRYLDARVPVGEHLADQLLLPLCIGAGGTFRTLPLTAHSRTNIEVIRLFLETDVRVTPEEDGSVTVDITGAGLA